MKMTDVTQMTDEKKQQIAAKKLEFESMLPDMMAQIIPAATQFSEQLTKDMDDIKRALAAIYKKLLQVEEEIHALQKS